MPANKYKYFNVKQIIKDKGGLLLSKKEEYRNTLSVIKIKCLKCNHKWETPFYRVNTNHTWCLKCSGKMKYTIERVRKIIFEKNGTLLSKEYKNSSSKIEIQCNKCKWIWWPKFHSIINSNSWCPNCAGNLKYDINHINNFINKLNGKLLSKKYLNNKSKLSIKCNACETIWKTNWDCLQRGHWCHKCSIGKSQKLLTNIIKDIYKNCIILRNYKGFSWLKNKKKPPGVHEIDIFVSNKGIHFSLAIEYNGKQHYMPVCFGGMSKNKAKKEFDLTKKRDKRKRYLFKKYSNDVKYFVIFNYKEKLTKENVLAKLLKKGVPVDFS